VCVCVLPLILLHAFTLFSSGTLHDGRTQGEALLLHQPPLRPLRRRHKGALVRQTHSDASCTQTPQTRKHTRSHVLFCLNSRTHISGLMPTHPHTHTPNRTLTPTHLPTVQPADSHTHTPTPASVPTPSLTFALAHQPTVQPAGSHTHTHAHINPRYSPPTATLTHTHTSTHGTARRQPQPRAQAVALTSTAT
jgi:hypothetical protein